MKLVDIGADLIVEFVIWVPRVSLDLSGYRSAAKVYSKDTGEVVVHRSAPLVEIGHFHLVGRALENEVGSFDEIVGYDDGADSDSHALAFWRFPRGSKDIVARVRRATGQEEAEQEAEKKESGGHGKEEDLAACTGDLFGVGIFSKKE